MGRQPPLILLALMLLTTQGPAAAQQAKLNFTSYPQVGQQDTMCSRRHTNTAFIGVEPYSTIVVGSASDCFRNCIENYPRCTAVVFYNLHAGELRNVCFSFDRNSADENVALIPEEPANENDEIRAFEITPYCYYFNPVPPLSLNYIDSTDHVSQTKRTSRSWASNTVFSQGAWSKWTQCSPKNPQQIRLRKCEYGRLINRRPCIYGSMYPAFRASVIIHANIPYPPLPYMHPECYSEEYDAILTRHVDEMREICCIRNDGNKTREIVQRPDTFVPNCRQICTQPVYNMSLDTQINESEKTDTTINDVPEGWGEWSPWSVCSATCDHGTEQRSRECKGGQCIGDSYQVRSCEELPPCKTWSEWTPYTDCPVTCGTGERTRSRFCYLGKNRCSGNDFEVSSCNLQPCAEWGQWNEWTACAPCGISEVSRIRTCFGVGSCLGPQIEHKHCILPACSEWSVWSEWSFCSASCGIGVKQRRRLCENGDKCEGVDVDEERCNIMSCAEWEPWSPWSSCSVSCGYGYELRNRACSGYADECEGESQEIQSCSMGDCPGFWSEWQEWSECSKELSEQTRRRVCLGPEMSCEPGRAKDVRTCNPKLNNIWGEWSPWSECPPCLVASETTFRTRVCKTPWCVGFTREERVCEVPPCSTWGTWSEWSECTETCGNGKRYRSRLCLHGNECVGPSEETDQCENNPPCVGWEPWSEWSQCNSQCGVGQKTRERVCNNGGYIQESCTGPASHTVQCLDRPCCEWTNWDKWMPCDRSCGDGKQYRVRQCHRPGDITTDCQCPGFHKEVRECHLKSCAPRTQTVKKYNQTLFTYDVTLNKDNMLYEVDGGVLQPYHTRGDRVSSSQYSSQYSTNKNSDVVPVPPEYGPGYVSRNDVSSSSSYKPGSDTSSTTVTYNNGAIGSGASYNPDTKSETSGGAPVGTGAISDSGMLSGPGMTSSSTTSYGTGVVPEIGSDAEFKYRPRDCLPQGNCYGYNQNVSGLNYTGPSTCRWSSWCNWTPCPNSCDYGLTRRHRYCVGDSRCVCGGNSVEKMHCSNNEECKKKRRKK